MTVPLRGQVELSLRRAKLLNERTRQRALGDVIRRPVDAELRIDS